jgi:hypothetical protein
VPTNIVPAGNLVVLKNTSTGGKGSELARSVSVILNARDVTPGSCPPGSSSDPVTVSLRLVDDDGDTILNESSKSGFVCTAGTSTNAKFTAFYRVENCKGSVAPEKTSMGAVDATASTAHGSLNRTRRVQCKD